MAEDVVFFLVENLSQLLIQEADRLRGVQEKIRGVKEEVDFMASLLERSEAIPEGFVTRIKDVIYEAEALINQYATVASDRQAAGFYKMPYYWNKLRRLAIELEIFGDKVGRFKLELPECPSSLDESGDPQSDVPQSLWRFIYYFLLFPANFEIPVRRLIVLWVAEGLIISTENRDDNRSVEDIAGHDLSELIKRGLIRVTKDKLNGKAQACTLKNGIREKWLTEAKKVNFFQSRKKQVRRLVDLTSTHDPDASFIRIHGNPSISDSVPEYGDVISFVSFDAREGSKPGEDIGNFLHECIAANRFLWLKILDLEKVFRPKLPKNVGKLIHLKYLGLRWTYLQHLPDFVDKLLELHVLDVKHTYINSLPSSIWRMMDLRHLYLSEAYRTKFPRRPSRGGSLTHLQTLWGAFIDEDTHVEEGLDTLEGIRKLGLSCHPTPSSGHSDMLKQLQAVDKWISKLGMLDSLRLKSRDKEGEAADLHLTTLENNEKLSTVYLVGRLNLDVVQKFPASLTDITLSGSGLNVDPMKYLEKLPKLQILRLFSKSVLHPILHSSEGGFPNLKVVYIWCLDDLEEWQVEKGSMPCLEEFEIRSCPNLKKLPHQLQNIEKLKKFSLTKMPERFMKEEKSRQPQLWTKFEQTTPQL